MVPSLSCGAIALSDPPPPPQPPDFSAARPSSLERSIKARVPDRLPLNFDIRHYPDRQPKLEELLTDLSERIAAIAESAILPLMAAIEKSGQPNDHPTKTLMGLLVQGRLTARAALITLQDPLIAYAAAPLIRTLVECWTYAHFIQQGGPVSGGAGDRCRAVALELGMARQRAKNFAELFGSSRELTPSIRTAEASIQQELRTLGALYKSNKCTCKVVNWTDVKTILDELHTRHHHLAKQIWVECSVDAHAHAPFRMMTLQGRLAVLGGPATYQFRFRMLRYINEAIFYLCASALMCLAAYLPIEAGDYLDVRQRFESVRRDSVAQEARTGKLDRHAER
jgi:hypothetical protein